MPYAINTGLIFLINTLVNLYLFVLGVRLLLVYSKANYFDPITQFITKLTDPLVKPIRRLIPNFRQLETSTLLLFLFISILKFLFIILISSSHFQSPLGLLILAVADFFKIMIEIFFYAILLQAILSFVQPYSPINRTLNLITAPIMQPLHRVIPPISGIDLSPIPALIGLQLLLIVLIDPLMFLGWETLTGV